MPSTANRFGEKDEIKGYEVDNGKFLLHRGRRDRGRTDQILAHAQSRDLRQQRHDIQQIYLDTPYYVTPADKVSAEAFAVIREAWRRRRWRAWRASCCGGASGR